ncbi:helix-turn-helix domain-containing protein [Stutzerimonas stutzeri]
MAHLIDGPNSELAGRLFDARRAKGLTQGELADLVGIDKRNISQYENGHAHPRGETLRKLSKHLNVEVSVLLTGMHEDSRSFLRERNKEARASVELVPKSSMTFIEDWETLSGDRFAGRRYKEGTSNPADYVPVLVCFGDNFKATRFLGFYPDNPSHPAGAILIFDAGRNDPSDAKNGDLVIFRQHGRENSPGLRRFVREPGTTVASLYPVDASSGGSVLSFDPDEYQIIGVVLSQVVVFS